MMTFLWLSIVLLLLSLISAKTIRNYPGLNPPPGEYADIEDDEDNNDPIVNLKQCTDKQMKGFITDYLIQPGFILLGTPKGGTTSLYKYISQHPDVASGTQKEPRYWDLYKFPAVTYTYLLSNYPQNLIFKAG